jgi:hypothetical protein
MAATRLDKFITDQEAAVQLARELPDVPSEYSIRVDAMNAALSLANSMSDERTASMADVVKDAKLAEAYLKGALRG